MEKLSFHSGYFRKYMSLRRQQYLAQGFDVEFLVPSRIKGMRTPDVKIDGVLWEMKCPTGSGKKTVEKQLQRTSSQSKNIIFDGRRTKLDDVYIRKELFRQYQFSHSLKRLVFINKDGQRIDIKH